MADIKKLNSRLAKALEHQEREKQDDDVFNLNDPTGLPIPRARIPFSYQATIKRNTRGDMISARLDPILSEG